MKFITSWDDNHYSNWKLLNLLSKHEIRGTFYLPVFDLDEDFVYALLEEQRQVGSHTMDHPQDIKLLSREDKEYEIEESKKYLERRFNIKVETICWPRGRYDKECLDIARKAGYKSCRTTLVGYTKESRGFIKHPTVHIFPRPEYKELGFNGWYDYAISILEKKPSYFHLWGHARDLERFNYWKNLDDFLHIISYENLSS